MFWGMRFAPFSHKTALDRRLVLSRLFRAKTARSHTAITSIEIRALHESKKKSNKKSLQKFLLLFVKAKSRVPIYSSLRGRIADSHEAINKNRK